MKALQPGAWRNGDKVTLQPNRLEEPLKWTRKPKKIFVCSMSDLFHEDVPDDYLDKVFDVIARSPLHTFQILTKRSDRMLRYFWSKKPPRNAWLGVSVENRKESTRRRDDLTSIDCSVRFVSAEPLLEDVSTINLDGIHWVIAGGESGRAKTVRPMLLDHARNLRDLCIEQGVAFFFKQWGEHDAVGRRVGKAKSGRLLDGRTWDEMPDAPNAPSGRTPGGVPLTRDGKKWVTPADGGLDKRHLTAVR
jgi:protein gp37